MALAVSPTSCSHFPLWEFMALLRIQHVFTFKLISPHPQVHVAGTHSCVRAHMCRVFPLVLFIDTYFYQIIIAP